jgi:hypothetical protein
MLEQGRVIAHCQWCFGSAVLNTKHVHDVRLLKVFAEKITTPVACHQHDGSARKSPKLNDLSRSARH